MRVAKSTTPGLATGSQMLCGSYGDATSSALGSVLVGGLGSVVAWAGPAMATAIGTVRTGIVTTPMARSSWNTYFSWAGARG